MADQLRYRLLSYALAIAYVVVSYILQVRAVNAAGHRPRRGRSGESFGRRQFQDGLRRIVVIGCGRSWTSRESLTLMAFGLVLALRTLMSLVVVQVDGYMVKQLIHRETRKIVWGLGMWLGVGVPSCALNAMISYLQKRLAIGFRMRLAAYLQVRLLQPGVYYSRTSGPTSIPHLEHLLTEVVEQWSETFASVCSTIGKPLCDLVLFSFTLFKNFGFWNQFIASIVVWESGQLLKRVRPPFASLVEQKAELEATLRQQHDAIVQSSEEIAFFNGGRRECSRVKATMNRIEEFTRSYLRKQFSYTAAEDFVVKYGWSIVGMLQLAYPLLQSKASVGNNARYLVEQRRVMTRNAEATEKLIGGVKQMGELRGYTMMLLRVLDALDAESDVASSSVIVDNVIDLNQVDILSPTNEVLISDVTFRLPPGGRLLVTGPNGCGKSALLRSLSGLWPHRGVITVPPRETTMFISQRAYMAQGTLREQFTYPIEPHFTNEDDERILHIAEEVLLRSVVDAHGGLDAIKSWETVLSGGERQRLCLARVLYHRPSWAILDESTSAVNIEAERHIFERLIREGMGLITVSHRRTLQVFHYSQLTVRDGGTCTVSAIAVGSDVITEEVCLASRRNALFPRLKAVLTRLGQSWPPSFEDAVDLKENIVTSTQVTL